MKSKISKIMGISLTFVLLVSMMVFALPVSADPGENKWSTCALPASDPTITKVGPVAQSPLDGDLYAYVEHEVDDNRLMKSENGGRTWAGTAYGGEAIVDMVCSDLFEDVIYVTDGTYVYRSIDGGTSFAIVAQESLEKVIAGECGALILNEPITCLDVGYDASDNSFVFIGVTYTFALPGPGPPSVLYISEAGYPSEWTDLELYCYPTTIAEYTPYAVGVAPDFATSKKTYVVVTTNAVGSTHVVSTTGTPCVWTKVSELVWDCDADNHFNIIHASRFAFPDDFADTKTMFIGVTDTNPISQGGDVYRVVDGPPTAAVDLNVQGYTTGCIGSVAGTNICSLDIMGDTADASLIAGAYDDTNVYCSNDGGWNWTASSKDPTGGALTYALWVGDSALAATSGTECAVSMSCGEDIGKFWNQISLIDTDIDLVQYLDHSPGYLSATSKTMFMLTGYVDGYTNSLFRHDGTYWERVFLLSPGSGSMMVLVSPDFNKTNTLYVATSTFDIWRSTDAGCSWTALAYPCEPKPSIGSGVVIDEDTGIVGGSGAVYKTTLHGTRPWDEYAVTGAGTILSFDLEPGYEDPGTILLGDNNGKVFISEDGGETWGLVGTALTAGADTSVVFDPGYAVSGDAGENTIYAAAGSGIYRFVVGTSTAWTEIYSDLDDEYWGIAVAGDTALYVGDRALVADTLPANDGGVDGIFDNGGLLRTVNATAVAPEFERVATGLDPGIMLSGLLLTTGSNVLWAIDWGTADVWTYEDPLATPVIPESPSDGALLGTTSMVTLEWEALDGATEYEINFYRYCPQCPDERLAIKVDNSADTCAIVTGGETGLTPGTTYYWEVRVAEGSPFLSKWSDLRSFDTALGAVTNLCSPICGAQDVNLTTNFSWDAVAGATGYEVQIATNEDFDPVIASGTPKVNAWAAAPELDYSTTYYWQVRAVKDGIVGAWSVCLFSTMAEPVEPVEPITPVEIITEEITPLWIWVIIGIGAALVIVVIVLIVSTRRVP